MVKITFESDGMPTKIIECDSAIGVTFTDVEDGSIVNDPFYVGKNTEVALASMAIEMYTHLLKQMWKHNNEYDLGQMTEFIQLIADKGLEQLIEEYKARQDQLS